MKLHMCCGDIYLEGYVNCDIVGEVRKPGEENPNSTTLDRYFKYPFKRDFTRREPRPFVVDKLMNLLEPWPFEDGSVQEIVSISAWEHFEHHTELPFIIREVYRVLRSGGVWKFDFPNIREIVDLYHDTDPEFMAEQIYCNHKNKYSVHQWGYTPQSIPWYLPPSGWTLEFGDVVKHDYPMTGVTATKL
jgi:SAM-dependent methyltransferase